MDVCKGSLFPSSLIIFHHFSPSYQSKHGIFSQFSFFSLQIYQSKGALRVPNDVPPPSEDCMTLNKAFKGWGTDQKAIIKVLGCRNSNQMRKIRERYQQLYNESLIDQLRAELCGDFRVPHTLDCSGQRCVRICAPMVVFVDFFFKQRH